MDGGAGRRRAQKGHGHDAPPHSRRSSGSVPRGHFMSLTSERTVKKLRLPKALTIPEGTMVHVACRRMAARRVDAVLLTDSNALLSGILTDKDITTRVIARELKMEETPVSMVMSRNPFYVLADTLVVDALQKMVKGKFRHLPVVENGEVIAILNIAKCLYDAIAWMERAAEEGKAIGAAVEAVENQWGAAVSGRINFVKTLRERMFRPSLSTVISENPKVVTIAPSDTVLKASKKMLELKVSSAVVAIENKPGGILTCRDILIRVIAQNLPPDSTTVEKVMTQSPECATVDTPILDALHTMHDGNVLHLPVLESDGNFVTVVDVLHITHAAIATLRNCGVAGSEATSAMTQRFWDSVMSIGPLYDDDDKRRMENMDTEFDLLESIIEGKENPSNLKLLFLQSITKNFSDKLKIGNGGCAVVYKGILRKQSIAVKRLLNSHTIEDKMFHGEVKSMMMVNHKNVVRFLGYCSHTEERALEMEGKLIMAQERERLLCFEYLISGSLESYLTDELKGLEWQIRYQIIKGICDGLYHLHIENHIIHMDLKPANILLDSNMVPKITDFGLSRLDIISQTMSSKRLCSLGYCAPEYLDHGKMSAKSDIYSLGVIILVLVTGSKEEPNINKVQRRWKHRWNKTAKDAQLGYKQVAACLDLVGRCMERNPINRPDINDIISQLNELDGSDAETSYSMELEDMLGIEPLEIHLPFELNKPISCNVELINDTDDHFAFRISTTSLRLYCIEPNRGAVPPRSKCSVTVSMQALDKALPGHQCRDEFCVQSTRVDGSIVATDILRPGGDIFNEEPGKVIDTVNFSVVLSEATSTSADQHV